MEKYKCKLCFRSFSDGRALGGHMRSHMMSLPIPPKLHSPDKLADEADSASSRSEQLFREEKRRQYEQNDAELDESLFYGLRENPKRSVKLVDPQFSMMTTLQDRESETESSKNPTRRRSRRARRPDKPEPWAAEPEPASSISDATTEEDVAFCLMMMSRDNWMKRKRRSDRNDDVEEEEEEEEEEAFDNDDEEEEEEESEFEGAEKRQQSGKCAKGKYKCETCDKVFRSYQALGGHRASHKKVKLGQFAVVSKSNDNESVKQRVRERESNAVAEKKSHQCPVCLRVFSSGQALGGHKRSHVIAAETTAATKTTSSVARSPVVVLLDRASSKRNKLPESLIDLNLPAPDYDDDDDETSQVSDAEFVNNAVVRQ